MRAVRADHRRPGGARQCVQGGPDSGERGHKVGAFNFGDSAVPSPRPEARETCRRIQPRDGNLPEAEMKNGANAGGPARTPDFPGRSPMVALSLLRTPFPAI